MAFVFFTDAPNVPITRLEKHSRAGLPDEAEARTGRRRTGTARPLFVARRGVDQMPKAKDVLTTGQVARICNVAPRTVSKWFDTGQLRGYRIPGSKDRRIPVSHLVRFMRAHNMPLDGLETGQTHILVVDSDLALTEVLKETLEAGGQYRVSTAATAFEAGMLAGDDPPDVLLIDVTLPDVLPRELCRCARTDEALRDTRIIASSGGITDGQGHALMQDGFDAFLRKPFEIRQLIELVEDAVPTLQ